jgi:RHS repeat-associated protein
VTDASGAVQWQWPYAANPFGEKAPVSGSGYVLNLRFPGQYFDAESGLTYNVNRDYEAATGRYIQSDPIGLAGGTSTYLYTSGRPLTNSDPLGRDDSASMYNPDFWNPGSPLTGHSCDDGYWDRYRDRYIDWTADHVIDVGPYAAGLAGGLWPKSLAPATGGRPALLGSTNPLTSVPRGFGVPGANAPAVRAGAALIGVATVGIGIYDATVILEGFIYAIPEN